MTSSKMAKILAISLFFISFLCFSEVHTPTPYIYPELLHFPSMPPTDNPPTIEGAALGRFLFYDPILSRDSTVSCATCHQQAKAFSDAPEKFSKGISGTLMKRNTMPLFNLPWYTDFFWDGRGRTIEEQAFHPIRDQHEMDLDWHTATKRIQNSEFYMPKFQAAFGQVKIDSTLIAKAIAQFERTLISHNAKYDSVLRGEAYFTPDEYEGFVLMNDQTKGDCLHCHTTDANALGTTAQFSNNGLDAFTNPDDFTDKGKAAVSNKIADVGLFKIPSLRNVSVTAPYMHDGRFQSLEEVLDFYSEGVQNSFNVDAKMGSAHKGGVHLTPTEKKQIVAFLHTLTDNAFLQNPAFSNPFEN